MAAKVRLVNGKGEPILVETGLKGTQEDILKAFGAEGAKMTIVLEDGVPLNKPFEAGKITTIEIEPEEKHLFRRK